LDYPLPDITTFTLSGNMATFNSDLKEKLSYTCLLKLIPFNRYNNFPAYAGFTVQAKYPLYVSEETI